MERPTALWFVLGVLAVWRMTHMLHLERGPWGSIARARAAADRAGLGGVVKCFFCLSLWLALPVAWWMASTWPPRVITWLALSAGAILIEAGLLRQRPK
jgi:hypothetical protein